MEDKKLVEENESSIDLIKNTIEEVEMKLRGISEDINIISKLMCITLILEIFILVFFLLEVQGI